MKKTDLFAASILALTIAMPAAAQDASPTVDPQAPAAPSSAVAASTDEYESAADIIVTATRRNETVQNVPVAITAVGAELLQDAGVTDIRGLEQLAPSLQTTTGQSQSSGASITIRGIGTAGDNPGFEPAVGVFIDGVFRSRAGTALSELPELERVEVLRGPQGTLFGRNTSGGALSVFTARPQFKFGGYVEGTYGNYDAYSLRGAVTGPVSETLALRIDGGYRKRDGYIKDANTNRRINDVDRYNIRAQALYETSSLNIRLIGDYSETDEQCCGAVSAQRGSLAPIVQGIAAAQGLVGLNVGAQRPGITAGTFVSTNPLQRVQAISPNRDYSERVRDYGASAEINADIGDLKLTSITAYRDFRALRNQDIDFSGIDRAYRQGYRTQLKDFTQELRLQGSAFDDKLDFLLGGFYLNENLSLRDTVRIGNDGNRYVDTIFNSLAGGQFFGSFTVPTLAQLGASLVGGPALPAGTRPLLGQLIYLQNPAVAPGVTLQQIAPPGSPLFALLTSPLPAATAGQGNNPDLFRVKTNAFAAFTHNIVHVTDSVSLTLGARYNREEKKLSASINNNTGSCGFFNQVRAGNAAAVTYANILRSVGAFNNLFLLGCNPAVNTEFNGTYRDKKTENALTGTAKLAFKVNDRVLAYASYDRGYKSGGYNLDQGSFDSVLLGGNGPQASDLRFGRETVDAYELGLKTTFSRAFIFNLAGFYSKIDGLQSLIFSGNNFVVQNIPKATTRGIEAEAIIQPARDFVVRLGYTYNEAVLDRSNNFTGTPLAGREGQQVGNVPKNVVTATATWTPPLTDKINGLLHVDMRYNSKVTLDGGGVVSNPGYALVSGRIGVTTDDRKLGLEFFVENIFNQYYNITAFGVPEQTGNFAAYPAPPRFYGVRARFGF